MGNAKREVDKASCKKLCDKYQRKNLMGLWVSYICRDVLLRLWFFFPGDVFMWSTFKRMLRIGFKANATRATTTTATNNNSNIQQHRIVCLVYISKLINFFR